jgi:hypothetical protein
MNDHDPPDDERLSDERLSNALRDLARHDAGRSAPHVIEQTVMAAFRARSRRRAGPLWLAAAAALLVGIGLSIYWPRASSVVAPEPAAEQAEVATEYLPLRAGPLLDPGEMGQVIRMQVPRREMHRFGLVLDPGAELDWNETVGADVLVGMDGTARAVRFVH